MKKHICKWYFAARYREQLLSKKDEYSCVYGDRITYQFICSICGKIKNFYKEVSELPDDIENYYWTEE